MTRSIASWLNEACEQLRQRDDNFRRDAETLLSWVLGKNRAYLFTWPEKMLTQEQENKLAESLVRRLKGEPVAYIIGEQEFWSMPFYVNRHTLIPRPDTEVIVEQALKHLPPDSRVLDLGTGSGAIALAVAKERHDCKVEAVDFSQQAIEQATKNRDRHRLENVSIYQSHWYQSVSGSFDLIVSNPPYIDAEDEHLSKGGLSYEPYSALVAEDNGLADIQHIVNEGQKYLNRHCWLMVEHGWQQKDAVQDIFIKAGYHRVTSVQDYGGNDRVTLGQNSE